jgi:hypothetical protein
LHFQDTAGEPLHKCIVENGNAKDALSEMNRIYQQSKIYEAQIVNA